MGWCQSAGSADRWAAAPCHFSYMRTGWKAGLPDKPVIRAAEALSIAEASNKVCDAFVEGAVP
jgi:hypothetical protein